VLGCTPDDSDDEIPFVPFGDIQVNLSLPQYLLLNSAGTAAYLNDGGVKGIILHHHATGEFYAFERNCSYHPADACSTVGIAPAGVYLTDTCCGSNFNFDGDPIGGPAWRPLRRYATFLNGGMLIVTDEIVE
jgi:hypothetical protein